jgi:hypothetical protein
MVMKIRTNMAVARKRGIKGVVYRSPRIYLPTKLTDDSSFPFLEGDDLEVRIRGDRLVVLRADSGGRRKSRSGWRVSEGRARRVGKQNAKRRRRKGLNRIGRGTKP